MKYLCGCCNRVFLIPATLTKQKHLKGEDTDFYDGITLETKVCPFCEDEKLTEYIETQPDIVSMKSVDINQVDEYLKQGYKVKDASTTKACIVKYAEEA